MSIFGAVHRELSVLIPQVLRLPIALLNKRPYPLDVVDSSRQVHGRVAVGVGQQEPSRIPLY